jgi:HAD superfamily hydrolase (TIGR01549 family)
MIKAVIFDIDGTLIDSVDFHARAWQEVFRRHGCETSFQAVRDQIGKGGDKLMSVFLSPEQIDREGKQLEEERSALFKREYLSQVKPFPCVRELFERIKTGGKKIALASSAKKDELEAYKRIAGIGQFLEAQTSSDDVSNSKPDPDIFLAALDGLKSVQPREAIAIGDTSYDAEAAGKAGMSTIGVLCGGVPPEKLLAAGCIAVYRDPADLLQKYDESPLRA